MLSAADYRLYNENKSSLVYRGFNVKMALKWAYFW
jgi:hypothetical protein